MLFLPFSFHNTLHSMGIKSVAKKKRPSNLSQSSSSSSLSTNQTTMVRMTPPSQTILEAKNRRQSLITSEHLPIIKSDYGFPESVNIHLPDKEERVDWGRPGWISIYTYPFKLGFKFPFSDLVRDFLSDNKLHPCQLMPQTWRILRAIEVLTEKHAIPFTAYDLGYTYDLRTSGKGRFTLTAKEGQEPLIKVVDKANDRGWMERFFFVEKSSLGQLGDFFQESFRIEEKTKTFTLLAAFDAKERVDRILAVDENERLYSELVHETQELSKKGVEEEAGEEEEKEKEEEEDEEDEIELIESKEGESKADSTMSPRTRKDRKSSSAAATSSVAGRSGPSDEELLAMASKKRKGTPASSAEPPAPKRSSTTVINKPPQAPKDKTQLGSASHPIKLELELSDEFCSLKSASKMAPEMDKFLIPKAKEYIKNLKTSEVLRETSAILFQGLQANLTIIEKITEMEDSLKKAKSKEEAAKKKAAADERALQALEEKYKKQTMAIKEKNERIKALEKFGRKKRSQVTEAAGYYAWRTRAELMTAFLNNETDKWAPQDDIDKWNNIFADLEPPVSDGEFDLGESEDEAESAQETKGESSKPAEK